MNPQLRRPAVLLFSRAGFTAAATRTAAEQGNITSIDAVTVADHWPGG